MIIGFIIICVIIALIIAGVQESNKQKQNNRKVSKYAPTSKGEAVRHISGLPVAESTDLYVTVKKSPLAQIFPRSNLDIPGQEL